MTSKPPFSLRFRRFLSNYFPLVVLGLLVLVMVVGYATYGAHATTEYESDERAVVTMTESTAFDHSALVVNESEIWNEGDVAENRPRYYLRLMPELDGEYRYEYNLTGVDDGDIEARTEITLHIRGFGADSGEEEEILWET